MNTLLSILLILVAGLLLVGCYCTIRAELAYRRETNYVTDVNPPLDTENP